MAQAPTYTRTTDFAEDERLNTGGRTTVRADRVNAELDALAETANQTRDNLELIQRDDGKLRDGVVTPESLSATTTAFLGGGNFNPRGDWATGASYSRLDLVEFSAGNYVCLSSHTAGASFATDRAAGKWQIFPGQPVASNTVFTPSGGVSSTDVQAAIVEVQANLQRNTQALMAFNFGAF